MIRAADASAISFEAVEDSDAEALASLRVAAMRQSLERAGRFDPARARARILADFSPECTRHIVAAGERVGFFVMRPQASGFLLDHLYISPERQNLGIGSAVLRWLFADADAQALDIRVGALRGSDSNRFYARHGFELVEQGEFDNYYVRKPQPATAPVERLGSSAGPA